MHFALLFLAYKSDVILRRILVYVTTFFQEINTDVFHIRAGISDNAPDHLERFERVICTF